MGREVMAKGDKLPHAGLLAASILAGPSLRDTHPTDLVVRMIEVTKLMRDQGDLMTPQAFQVVFEIARQPGITMQGLEKATGLALGSISRNLMALGEYHRLGKEGLKMVETADDPTERRRKIAFLTKKGEKFVSDVLKELNGGQRVDFDSPTSREFLSRAYSANIRR